MLKPHTIVLAIVAGVGAWYFVTHYGDSLPGMAASLPDEETVQTAIPGSGTMPPLHDGTLRIAAFNLETYGPTKAARPLVTSTLSRIFTNFDIVAIQEVRSRDQSLMPALVDQINADGRAFDYVIGPRVGRSSTHKEQFVYLFDTTSVEVDRYQSYTVDDPQDLLNREPFVAWFRAKGPRPDESFTFSLVNVHTDPDEVRGENTVLDDVVRVVRNDGREEDDVIVIGDFNASVDQLEQFMPYSQLMWAVGDGLATNTRGTQQYDNLGFNRQFTDEFTGRGGVFDMLREFNMSIEQALSISDHMPVWAEFSRFEGGVPGRFAARPLDLPRR